MLSEAKHLVIARGASLVAIKRVERSKTVDCFASLAMTQRNVIASNQRTKNHGTFDCFGQALAMTQGHVIIASEQRASAATNRVRS